MTQTSCKQCGTCCRNGGPALHGADLDLVGQALTWERLVCVRRGEMSVIPLTGKVEPAAQEFIKVAGKPGSWECLFLTSTGQCSLHPHKPLECRVLECWRPQGISDLMGQDLLNRWHLLPNDSPMLPIIEQHEEQCSFQLIDPYLLANKPVDKDLEQLLANDMLLRQQAVANFDLTPALEMFYFGRPLFMTLQGAGWRIWEDNANLRVARP